VIVCPYCYKAWPLWIGLLGRPRFCGMCGADLREVKPTFRKTL